MARDKSRENSQILQLFGAGLRSVLKSRGIRQTRLASGLGVDARNVSRWVNGKAIPNAVWVAKIADYLGVSLDELFGRQRPGGDSLQKIRDHAQQILDLAGGEQSGEIKKQRGAKKPKRKKP